MTEQRFDIIVQDKVAPTIKTELAAIGSAAQTARGFIGAFKNELAGLSTVGGGMAGASTNMARGFRESAAAAQAARQAIDAQRQAIERLNAASARGGAGPRPTPGGGGGGGGAGGGGINPATAAQIARLGTTAGTTASALSNLAAKANQAANNLSRVRPPAGPPPDTAPANSALTDLAAAARSAADELRRIQTNPNAGGARFNYSGGSAGRPFDEMGESAGLASQHVNNLLFQLNDIFVSLASGQKPLTVFIQQGSQIGQIALAAGLGWKAFGAAVLTTLGIFTVTTDAALTAAAAQASAHAAGVAGALASAQAAGRAAAVEIALAEAQLASAASANATAAAEARLTLARQAHAAAAAEAAVAEQALATAQAESAATGAAAAGASTRRLSTLARGGIVVAAAAALAATAIAVLNKEAASDEEMLKYAQSLGLTAKEIKKLEDVTVTWGDTAKAVFQVGFRNIVERFGIDTATIKRYWDNTMSFLASAVKMTVAGIYAAFAGMAYGVNNIIQNLGDGKANDNPFANVVEGYKEAYNDAQQFFDDVAKQSTANAKGRIGQQAKDLIADRGPGRKGSGAGAGGFDRAAALAKDNEQLDIQIGLLAKYGQELDRANQLEGIAAKYRENKVPLTTAELAALEAKILTLQKGAMVQDAMTAADEHANGAARQYEATLEALDTMLGKAQISQADYNSQLKLATQAYDDAIDPLAALNRELMRNGELMGKYGRDRDVADYIQQLQQAAEAQGKSIYRDVPPDAEGTSDIVVNARGRQLNPDAQAMVDEFKRQREREDMTRTFEAIDPRENEDPGSNSYILDHQKELYAELDRMRQEDFLKEEEIAERKRNLDRAITDARLETMSGMFGQLASLQSSSNKKLAALGKAAAIAQATIDGYRAVQAALAGPPGPPWSFAIAGVTAAMTAMNVAKIAGVGFKGGGYTGNMPVDQKAGDVHGQEYVFDAAATKRIGVPALEALRRNGHLSAPPSMSGMGAANVTVRPMPGVFVEEVRTPAGEIELIARRVAREEAPKAVASDISSGANSKTSQALKAGYGLQRSDR